MSLYIFGYHRQVEREEAWMTKYWILPLWLTIHSPLLCGLLLARCQYLHRSNIVRVGHPTDTRLDNVDEKSRCRDSWARKSDPSLWESFSVRMMRQNMSRERQNVDGRKASADRTVDCDRKFLGKTKATT